MQGYFGADQKYLCIRAFDCMGTLKSALNDDQVGEVKTRKDMVNLKASPAIKAAAYSVQLLENCSRTVLKDCV
jgi:hypothetical protein